MPKDTLFSRAFGLAFGANFLHSLAFFGYLHLPGYLSRLGADELMIGIVVGAMAASAIASRPALGWLMDRRGRHLVAQIGSVIHLVIALCYLLIDSVGPLLFIIRVVHGIAEAMLFSSLFTIAADVAPASRRTEGIAWFGISGLIPMALSGLLGDLILKHADYPELFIACASVAALGGLCAWGLTDSRPKVEEGAAVQRSFFAAVMQPRLRPLWLMGFAFALAIASYFTFLKTFIEEAGVGSMGLFYSVYSVAAVLLRLALGWVPDRIGPRLTLGPAMVSVIVGLATLALATGDLGVAIAGLLCGTGHAFVFPILSSLVVSRAAAHERGAALAMFTALFDFGMLVGSPLLGAVLEATDYTSMFGTAGSIAVVGSVVYAFWDRAVVPPERAAQEA
ncbi:MAG: MFS transporter [Myxococcota bacterium]